MKLAALLKYHVDDEVLYIPLYSDNEKDRPLWLHAYITCIADILSENFSEKDIELIEYYKRCLESFIYLSSLDPDTTVCSRAMIYNSCTLCVEKDTCGGNDDTEGWEEKLTNMLKVKDARVGENVPPFRIGCRCEIRDYNSMKSVMDIFQKLNVI